MFGCNEPVVAASRGGSRKREIPLVVMQTQDSKWFSVSLSLREWDLNLEFDRLRFTLTQRYWLGEEILKC